MGAPCVQLLITSKSSCVQYYKGKIDGIGLWRTPRVWLLLNLVSIVHLSQESDVRVRSGQDLKQKSVSEYRIEIDCIQILFVIDSQAYRWKSIQRNNKKTASSQLNWCQRFSNEHLEYSAIFAPKNVPRTEISIIAQHVALQTKEMPFIYPSCHLVKSSLKLPDLWLDARTSNK